MVVRLFSVLTLICILGVDHNAFAKDDELAKSEFKEGYSELQKKHYAAALNHYEASYRASPRPRTLFNIALCHEGMGNSEEAIAKFQEFIQTAEARDAAFLSEAREKLKALHNRTGAQLSVTSRPTGASVIVDNQVRGHTPMRLHLTSGQHILKVRKRGARTSSRRITVRAGENISESFQLDSIGHLKLHAKPRDALIRRKGVDDVGTGTYEANLSPGRYDFEVSLAGYRTRALSITLKANDSLNKNVQLEALSDTAELRIQADRLNARVSIDGLIVGSTRDHDGSGPSLERRLIAGYHVIFVEYENKETWRKRVHLSPGEVLKVNLTYQLGSGRNVASWSLSTLGTVGMIAGVTMGVLAVSDLRSDSNEKNNRGSDRATTSGILLGVGLGGLIGGHYLGKGSLRAEVERDHQ
tara:strand:- start:20725 stop:21963 length:1239 start_codon:yes stop_codon:yes gene_type:complete